MISHEQFMDMTDKLWSAQEQLVFLAENQDWCDLFFNVIREHWDEIQDTMEIDCLRRFALSIGKGIDIPRDA